MRYLGNKSKLLNFINSVIEKYDINGDIFCDLFAGTGSVGDFFKGKYKVISNDYMYFSYVINCAKLLNDNQPGFEKFNEKYKCDPFIYLNNLHFEAKNNFFIYNNYTEIANRFYFTKKNAIKIDGIRLEIEELYKNNYINKKEYMYLLASLIESVMGVSNTAGTYQAYFKFWDSRALKEFIISPLEINNVRCLNSENIIYNEESNKLVREINGDIVYIDPPYTSTQYTNSYHILETIAKYDYPDIFGKTGRRSKRILSDYSNKNKAIYEFEDLFRQLNFKYILVSYSNQSLISLDELINLAKKFSVNGKVYIESNEYREYSTNNNSYKGNGEKLKETIIYFEKDNSINKSPLNYSGSKDLIMAKLIKELPKHISTFVDMMGGAFNVGANIVAMDSVVYNEYNKNIYETISMLLKSNRASIIYNVEKIIKEFQLKKKGKEEYLELREKYNNSLSFNPLYLYTLHIYSFQNIIRINSKGKFNTPIGNNEFSEGNKNRILNFHSKTNKYILSNQKYQDFDIEAYDKDTLFYFDPPYFITNAEYNDGKRGLDGWNINNETELLNYLNNLHNKGYKFMLSNVLYHNNKTHHMLIEWIEEHNFDCVEIGRTGIKYPRIEVLIKNF